MTIPPTDIARRRERLIAIWLLVVAVMVLVMVVIGGLTRLTHSGLSMVEWRPLTGWLPPMTEPAWQRLFEAYQESPEFRQLNAWMSLDDFKGIFWLEFIHRVWGRLIGVVFAVPLAFFVLRGWVRGRMGWKLAGIFVLGGLQGVMGWYMVMSGLSERPDVSHYRLAAHLMLALVIYMALLWTAFRLILPDTAERPSERPPPGGAFALVALVLLTTTWGAFVAGLDAGFAYNTFPLMDGEWLPVEAFTMSPPLLSLLEEVAAVQFAHRWLAMATLAWALGFWVIARRRSLTSRARAAVAAVPLVALCQVGLGIATLLLYVPVAVASVHQAGAVILLTVAFWAAFEALPAAPAGQSVQRVRYRRAEAGADVLGGR